MKELPILTEHAKERFIERMRNICPQYKARNVEKNIKEVCKRAKKTRLTPAMVARILRHGVATMYYETPDGWRLILTENDDGQKVLLTVEHVNWVYN